MKFAFYVAEKDRNWGLAEAVAESAAVHGDEVEIIPQRMFQGVRGDADGGACLGVKRAGKRLLGAHLQAGRHFLFFDKAYMNRANYVRVSVDAWQPTAYFRRQRPADRFERMHLTIEPRHGNGEEVMFAGSSQKYCNFHDLGDATQYAERVVRKLKKNTKRQIIYRPKPSWAVHHAEDCKPIESTRLSAPGTPIREELARCHLLVTHGSNAAADALLAGVPVMMLGDGIFSPMSMGEDYRRIEDPYFPSDEERSQFFYDLAYCQWTLDEFRSGEAWADLRSTLIKLGPPGATSHEESNSLAYVSALYRQMHEHPKYFRGREAHKHFAKIGRLVLMTGAQTLLDYGCGKGEQYEPPLSLHEAWGIEIACYDPGVERFAVIPEGTFDGVICCDVMEHIPEAHVGEILRDIFCRAAKFVFLSIATMPASKCLPDGRNCHLTVRPEAWWREQIRTARMAVGASELMVETSIYNAPVMPDEEDDE